ncbi:uncharacterized protein N7503_010269 [Penicillium pulvis]|uniref:uncharacterized protein n=1 Tax=Penicillium pulvis TaxID=1562058 RepID=UPI002547F88A|nr:uncharacterized protein N7503_010269 [Penicillium pulvis]KAJ5785057.1 hypothetical protein N7503_010269 [Penicillium pulvis]
MADCPFARCPTEVVHTILSYLDHTSPLSLRALAYTSKDFLLVSSPFIYHTVKIQLDREDLETITTKTNRLYRELNWVNAFSEVRCLIIEPPRHDGKQISLPSTPIKRDVNALRQYVLDTPSVPCQTDFQYPTTTQEADDMWLPIANLLRQLPSLNDLLYGGLHQFAPCLLKAIHENSSSCQLWLNNFKLHSLGAEQIDSHELALLSSPCLYSIKLDGFAHEDNASRYRSLDQENVYNEESICRTVASLSPNLKEFHAHYCGDQAYIPTDEPEEQQNRSKIQTTRGSLQYLSIRGDENKTINKETVTMWNDCTDFSALRTLRVTSPLRHQALEFLANDCNFTSLQSLELNLSLFATRLAWRLGQFDTPETRFLCSLPPLSTLTLHNWTNKYPLECFLPHHGSQITKLVISTGKNAPISPSDLKIISEYCPNLQELEVTLRRTQGDDTEVECYRNIGSLSQLRNLTIKLDVTSIKLCSSNYGGTDAPAASKCVITAPDASFNEFDLKPCVRRAKFTPRGCLYRNGDIREILINHAIDENLAQGIFKTIQGSKRPGTEPLQSLNISCVGTVGLKKHHTGSVWRFPHQEVLSALKRPWRLTRLSECKLKVEGKGSTILVETNGPGDRPLPAWLEVPLRRIWPQKQEGSSWLADWHSLPLCMT